MAQYIPAVLSGIQAASTASDLAQKYAPDVKHLADNLFSSGKRQSAMQYIKGLGSVKGIKKLVTEDIPHVVKKASKYITSGKFIKGVKNVASDAGAVLDVAKPLLGDETHGKLSSALQSGVSQAEHFHDIAHGYNEQGKQLVNQFKDQLKTPQKMLK